MISVDSGRGVVFGLRNGTILKYHLEQRTADFVAHVGGCPLGMDIKSDTDTSPTLYVADPSKGNTSSRLSLSLFSKHYLLTRPPFSSLHFPGLLSVVQEPGDTPRIEVVSNYVDGLPVRFANVRRIV